VPSQFERQKAKIQRLRVQHATSKGILSLKVRKYLKNAMNYQAKGHHACSTVAADSVNWIPFQVKKQVNGW
jgi:hypothetical protein